MDADEVRLRVLASAILYRACLRALAKPPTAEEKMALHARVEVAAWEIPRETLAEVDGRDVDDGPPASEPWRALVESLIASASGER